jgi:hypothetical protein
MSTLKLKAPLKTESLRSLRISPEDIVLAPDHKEINVTAGETFRLL